MYVPAARLTSQLTVYGSVHAIRPSPSSLKYSSVLKLESTPQDLELSVDCISSPKSLPVRGSFMSSTSCILFGPGLWGRQ